MAPRNEIERAESVKRAIWEKVGANDGVVPNVAGYIWRASRLPIESRSCYEEISVRSGRRIGTVRERG